MDHGWKTEKRACACCGALLKAVRRGQKFCSHTNHRYLHHTQIKPRIRRRASIKIHDRVEIEIVRTVVPGEGRSPTTHVCA